MKTKLSFLIFVALAIFFTGCVKDEPVPPVPPPPPTELSVMYYWHFNNLPEGNLNAIAADFAATGTANISYPGTGSGYMDRFDPGTDLNAQLSEPAGFGLRPRNPANTRELLIIASSAGFEELEISFAVHRSANGAQENEFYYSPDGGTNWVKAGNYEVPLDWELRKIDLSEIDAVNNNPNLCFKILFTGVGADGTTGNNRYDNFAIWGKELAGAEPVKLAIVAVNNGINPVANEEFSVNIQVQDNNGFPAAVSADTPVTLSLASGSGSLGGTITGIIPDGSSSLVITGVTYSQAEQGVSITATAAGLAAATSQLFDVDVQKFTLTLQASPEGSATFTGAGKYEAGTVVQVTASPKSGYEFTSWTLADGTIITVEEFEFTMPASDVTHTAFFTQIPATAELIHYWHFNALEANVAIENPIVDNIPVIADFSATGEGKITYPGTGDGWWDTRSHRPQDPVSNFNLRLDQAPDEGNVLRVRNPSVTRALVFEAPTTGFSDLVVTFATTRTANGAQDQEFYYSADGGNNWVLAEPAYPVNNLDAGEGYTEKVIDLSEVDALNNNPQTMFRILMVGEGSANPTGNNRFDNFSVDGFIITKR